MNSALATAMLILGISVIAVRRRTNAVLLLGAQSIALAAIAFGLVSGSGDGLVIAGVLLGKAVLLAVLLLLLVRRTPEPRPVTAAAGPAVRLSGAIAVAISGAALMPALGLGERHTERIALALLLVGMAIVVARRPIIFQLLGLIVAENGLSLLAVSVPGGLSYVIEFGALFDLALIVTVAAAFTQKIHDDLGTGNTELLRGLRD